jgi:type VI secretion system protein ImpE
MEIKDLIHAGKLDEARRQLVAAVKASPADTAVRTLLFQVLCYLGEWGKADQHLQAIAAQDSRREGGVLGYRNIVHAEIERHEVIDKNKNASFVSDPPDYIDLFLQIRSLLDEGKASEAGELLAKIDSRRPLLSGKVNDTPFVGFCDTDATLFPFLEVIAHDRYLWLPFESIREISVAEPLSLLDLLWIAARITTWEGLTMNCFLPVLYPHSFLHTDEKIKMGRMTDWLPLAGPYARGVGRHVFDVGGKDMSLFELHEIVFNFPGNKQSDEEKD